MKLLEKSAIFYLDTRVLSGIYTFLQLTSNITNSTQYIAGTIPYTKFVVISLYIIISGSIPVGILFLWLIYRSRKKKKELE